MAIKGPGCPLLRKDKIRRCFCGASKSAQTFNVSLSLSSCQSFRLMPQSLLFRARSMDSAGHRNWTRKPCYAALLTAELTKSRGLFARPTEVCKSSRLACRHEIGCQFMWVKIFL